MRRAFAWLHWELWLSAGLFLAGVYGAVFLVLIGAYGCAGLAVCSACFSFFAFCAFSQAAPARMAAREQVGEELKG